jgi:inner membrane protein
MANTPNLTIASPVPLAFWQRDMLWRIGPIHGQGRFDLADRSSAGLAGQATHRSLLARPDIRARLERDPEARAFLFWARMPVATIEGDEIVLRDYRFMDPLTGDRFTVRVPRD